MKRSPQKPKRKTRRKAPTYLREVEVRYKKRKVSSDSAVGKPIRGAKQIASLFADLQNEAKEKLVAISVDTKLKIICFEVVAIGSVKAIYLKPFEAIRASIAVNASGVILVHNHPSGDCKPGANDKRFTRAMKKIADLGGLDLHDHIIIGEDDFFSFAEEGLL